MTALRIYVAGPLSAPSPALRLRNVRRAIAVATALAERGWHPFLPHLSHYWDPTERLGYAWWMGWCREWLGACDALYWIGSSPGADREAGWARALGLEIYQRLADVPRVDTARGESSMIASASILDERPPEDDDEEEPDDELEEGDAPLQEPTEA